MEACAFQRLRLPHLVSPATTNGVQQSRVAILFEVRKAHRATCTSVFPVFVNDASVVYRLDSDRAQCEHALLSKIGLFPGRISDPKYPRSTARLLFFGGGAGDGVCSFSFRRRSSGTPRPTSSARSRSRRSYSCFTRRSRRARPKWKKTTPSSEKAGGEASVNLLRHNALKWSVAEVKTPPMGCSCPFLVKLFLFWCSAVRIVWEDAPDLQVWRYLRGRILSLSCQRQEVFSAV